MFHRITNKTFQQQMHRLMEKRENVFNYTTIKSEQEEKAEKKDEEATRTLR